MVQGTLIWSNSALIFPFIPQVTSPSTCQKWILSIFCLVITGITWFFSSSTPSISVSIYPTEACILLIISGNCWSPEETVKSGRISPPIIYDQETSGNKKNSSSGRNLVADIWLSSAKNISPRRFLPSRYVVAERPYCFTNPWPIFHAPWTSTLSSVKLFRQTENKDTYVSSNHCCCFGASRDPHIFKTSILQTY